KDKPRNMASLAYRYIKRAAARHLRKTKYIPPVNFSTLVSVNDEGEEEEFEIVDVLADIENQMIEQERVKEKVALLSKGDQRRKMILNAWASGEYNDLELARVLAHSYGGQINTHRIFIRRFRIECQQRLFD